MTINPTASTLAAAGVAFAPEIAQAARRHGLDPKLLAAVAAQETGGPQTNAGHNVVGDGGHGHGLFQIDDRWHDFAKTPEAMNPAKNADYAAGMLSGLLRQNGGNVRAALSAYNAGDPHATGTKTRWADGETLGYADSVMRHYADIAGGEPLEETAVAENPALIASIGALGNQAQSLPMQQPTQSAPPQSYHRQATDYSGLFDDADD